MHVQDKVWYCNDCAYLSQYKKSVTMHVESKHIDFGDDLLCPFCPKAFRTRRAMKKHKEANHRNEAKGVVAIATAPDLPDMSEGL